MNRIVYVFIFSNIHLITSENIEFSLHIVSDFNYQIFPKNGNLSCDSSKEEECRGGLSRLLSYKDSLEIDHTDIWLGAGGFFDKYLYPSLHHTYLLKAIDLMRLDAVSLDGEVYQMGIEEGAIIFNDPLKDILSSINLPNVNKSYIRFPIIQNKRDTKCSLIFLGFDEKERVDSLQIPHLKVEQEIDKAKEIIKTLNNSNNIYIMFGQTTLDTAEHYLNTSEVTGVIMSGADPALNSSHILVYENNNKWILGVDKTNIYSIGKINFFVDVELCKINFPDKGTIVDYSINSANIEMETDSNTLIKDIVLELNAEYNNPLHSFGSIATLLSKDECMNRMCPLGATLTDFTYSYVLTNNNDCTGVILPASIFKNNSKPIGGKKEPVLVSDITQLINDYYLCTFTADYNLLLKLFQLAIPIWDKSDKEYFLQVSNTMHIEITLTNGIENPEFKFQYLTANNIFLELNGSETHLWITTCNLFSDLEMPSEYKDKMDIKLLNDHNTILNIVKYILYEYGKYTFIPSLGYERYQDGYCKLPEGTTTTSTTEVSTTHKYTTKATTETSPEYSEQTTTQIRSTTEHTPEFEDECRDNIEFIISTAILGGLIAIYFAWYIWKWFIRRRCKPSSSIL